MKRREFVAASLVGLGAVSVGAGAAHATPSASTEASGRASGTSSSDVAPSLEPHEVAQAEATAAFGSLLQPLAAGSVVASSTVLSTRVDEWGTGVVRLRGENGREYRVDVCTRSSSDTQALASTSNYELFVRNGGAGSKKTDEGMAQAALAIANVVSSNEASVAPVALVTKSEYWTSEYWQRQA